MPIKNIKLLNPESEAYDSFEIYISDENVYMSTEGSLFFTVMSFAEWSEIKEFIDSEIMKNGSK